MYFSLTPEGSYKVTSIEPTSTPSLSYDELTIIAAKLPIAQKRDQFTVVGSRSHMNHETEEFIATLENKYGKINLINRGSSLKMCMIAEGTADIYPRFSPTWEWDTAAGQAIVEGAGCQIISAETNQRVVYNKEDLLNPWFIVKAK